MSSACVAAPKMIQYFCSYMHLFGDISVSVLAHRGGFYINNIFYMAHIPCSGLPIWLLA